MSQTATARHMARPGSPKGLPGAVRLLLAGDLVTAVGVGLTQPYLVVLLHTVRGVPLVVATAVVSLAAVASLVGNPVAGTLIDRYGPRVVMLSGLVLAFGGLLALALGPGILAGAAGVAASGLGWSLAMPALAAGIAALVPEQNHTRAYTFQYALFNAGMGGGAAIGGIAIALAPPDGSGGGSMLPMLWLVAAATCVVSMVITAVAASCPPVATGPGTRPGYRAALGDRALLRVLGAAALLATVGYGIYGAAPSVLAIGAHDPAALSWLNVANCAVVVLGVPVALRVTERVSARAALAWAAALWAVASAVCIPAAYGVGPSVRVVLTVSATLIGAGELLVAGALPTIVNALAPEVLRGRYNALLTLSLTVGMGAGPLLTSAATATGHVGGLFLAAVGLVSTAVVLLLRPVPASRPNERRLIAQETAI